MSYQSIMVYTDGDALSQARIGVAGELADQLPAALIGIAAGAPRPPHYAAGEMVPSEIEAEMKALTTALAATEKNFQKLAASPGRTVEWRVSHRLPDEAVVEEARCADLIVIGPGESRRDPFRTLDPGVVLLRAGRPVLFVPPPVRRFKPKKVLVAWQDTREARRAVYDSIPFLQQADEILLTVLSPERVTDEALAPVRDVARYLSRHRIGAAATVTVMSGDDVGSELVRLAEVEKIDLIVAGAYGHSRLGEWVFGGVTRDLLERSPACCLLSH